MDNRDHYKLMNNNRYRGRAASNRLSNCSGKAGEGWGAGGRGVRDQLKDLYACI